ncbi:hypothetical protein NDI56_05840 [Haloarcula sp. S1CR25-12]|uniref:Uncharacterized protein n=1 Tax=Haloarcula saliterrae TaxID=2950534 RepID=A0ABU2F9G2_9EURY|nr:hypothetical protein [Haloarcula sp. S1CR25-12]MDS0258912.1 hypothetical protein [Haloarcula sp. S1CR25-12]
MTPDQNDDPEIAHAEEPTLARTIIEERDGYPAHVRASEGEGDSGLLRVGFRGREEDLKELSWEQFREEFTEKDLVALYRPDEGPVENDRPVVLRERDHVDGDS